MMLSTEPDKDPPEKYNDNHELATKQVDPIEFILF